MTAPRGITLLLADVDGTLVTPDKSLTEAAIAAARALHRAGILFAIASSRPPLGLRMLITPLALTCPIAAFNGGLLVRPDLTPLESHPLDAGVAAATIDCILNHGLDAWVYSESDWFVRDGNAPHVAHEHATLQLPPTVVPRFADAHLARAFKIVGVSDDPGKIVSCTAALKAMAGPQASIANSQPYFTDVTHVLANKGAVVATLSKLLDVPRSRIATLGDTENDVPMFRESGFSIAMGNATDTVKVEADAVTASNMQDGFAKAVRNLILAEPA